VEGHPLPILDTLADTLIQDVDLSFMIEMRGEE
jgi:hypothetical protein